MTRQTIHVVQPFERQGRKLVPGRPTQFGTVMEAIGRAERDAARYAGVAAFTQTVDIETGELHGVRTPSFIRHARRQLAVPGYISGLCLFTSIRRCVIGSTMLDAPTRLTKLQFPRRLGSLMLLKGWSQADLAEASGLSSSLIGAFIGGQSFPTMSDLQKLALALDTTPEELLPNHDTARILQFPIRGLKGDGWRNPR